MNRGVFSLGFIAALAVSIPGCHADRLRSQKVALGGKAEHVSLYVGSWFDESGRLILQVSGGVAPELAVNTSRAFALQSASVDAESVRFDLRFSERIVENTYRRSPDGKLALYSDGELFQLEGDGYFLTRDPSAAWLAARAGAKRARAAHQAYDEVLDWLARRL